MLAERVLSLAVSVAAAAERGVEGVLNTIVSGLAALIYHRPGTGRSTFCAVHAIGTADASQFSPLNPTSHPDFLPFTNHYSPIIFRGRPPAVRLT